MIVKSVEEERTVTIVSFVVALETLLASVLEERIRAVVVWETVSDYSGVRHRVVDMTATRLINEMAVAKFSGREHSSCNIQNLKW